MVVGCASLSDHQSNAVFQFGPVSEVRQPSSRVLMPATSCMAHTKDGQGIPLRIYHHTMMINNWLLIHGHGMHYKWYHITLMIQILSAFK
jgi:hypothetical protein